MLIYHLCFLGKCLVRFFTHFGLVCICMLGLEEKPEASDPVELELQAVVSHLVWVPGMELRSSGRAACNLNC